MVELPLRLVVATLVSSCLAACGNVSSPGEAAGSSSGGVDAGAEQHAAPPEPGPLHAPDGTGSVTFAIRRFYVGDTDRDGTPNLDAGWRQYGYDLDGKISTEGSTDLCRPLFGAAPKLVYPDGIDGIDNSFGRNTLVILLGIASDFSLKVNAAIEAGASTNLFTLDGLGAGSDLNPIAARFYRGMSLGHPAAFDGSDAWPVLASLLADPGDLGSSKVTFPQSYVVGDVWVGHAEGDLPITMTIFGSTPLVLPLSRAVVSMKLDPDHQGATQGTLAGILAIPALVGALQKVANGFDPSLCTPPPIDSVLKQIKQAADILQGGEQDPTKDCDGISVGLGFDAALVKLGPIVPEPIPPAPCSGSGP